LYFLYIITMHTQKQIDFFSPITVSLLTFTLFSCISSMGKADISMTTRYPAGDIAETASFLPGKPAGLGRPINNRSFWEEKQDEPGWEIIISRAEHYLDQGLPDLPDSLFLEFSQTGNRTNWERVSFDRRGRIRWYTLAECLENQGRFLPALKELMLSLCKEKTWVMPAHDGDLSNFRGKDSDIDLGSAMLAWDMASALYLLGPVMDKELSEKIRSEIRYRVLDPYIKMVTGEKKKNWWVTTTNNWNAVCLAGVTGAALATAVSREERALFIHAADEYIKNFLNGFARDGYCTEGLGYWNYGFGHFLLLAETIFRATGGHINFYKKEKARGPALFGARIHIINHVYPAFADCRTDESPSPLAMFHVTQRIAPGLGVEVPLHPIRESSHLYETLLYTSPFPYGKAVFPERTSHGESFSPGIRDWFGDAGILVCRPGHGKDVSLGAAFKGGHNDEHHNHNDVGSFVVVSGNSPVLFDPGSEVYTARTFSSQRYKSKLLNSYGHPVPVVAGKLQKTGPGARGVVVSKEFSEKKDSLVLDMSSAYNISSLTSLTRTFIYSREGKGFVTITDRVCFSSRKTFETTLITPGVFERVDNHSLLIFTLEGAVNVAIDTGGLEFTITKDIIKEESLSNIQPTRIGISLDDPVTEAAITLQITPARGPGSGKEIFLNGGFEYSSMSWSLGNNNMAQITPEKKASGHYALWIEDESEESGTDILSGPIICRGEITYHLKGKYYPVSGNGFGIYIRFFHQSGEMINQMNEKGWLDPVGVLGGNENRWQDFSFSFTTPPGTHTLRVWLHSFNKARVTGYLDDLTLHQE
jgi:hypothetical protein